MHLSDWFGIFIGWSSAMSAPRSLTRVRLPGATSMQALRRTATTTLVWRQLPLPTNETLWAYALCASTTTAEQEHIVATLCWQQDFTALVATTAGRWALAHHGLWW